MGAFGDWRAPFPLRFGGRPHAVADMLYQTVKGARPDALAGGAGTEVDLENKVMARLLWMGWRATARRVAQRDPAKLTADVRPVTLPDTGTIKTTSTLARWEALLHLTPAPGASARTRRAAVKAALVSTSSARRVAVEDAMRAIFGSWLVGLAENRATDVDYPGRATVGDVHAYWPTTQTPPTPDAFHGADKPGEFSTTYPWRSALCLVCVQIQPPASTSQDEIDAKVGKAAAQLDDMLPAWMSATISQFPPDQTVGGFYAGVSLVGLTAVLPMSSTKVFIPAISTGERLTAAKINGLDTAQYNSLTRNENVPLLADSGFDLSAFDFLILGSGAGKFKPDGAYTEFQGYPKVDATSRAVTGYAPPAVAMYDKVSSVGFSEGIQRIQQVVVSRTLNFWITLPIGTVISTVSVGLKKASGTAGLPGVMPTVALYYYDMTTDSTATAVGSAAADTSANIAAYRTFHLVTTASLNHTVAAGRNYIVSVTGDDDSSSSGTGLNIYRPYMTVTASTLRAMLRAHAGRIGRRTRAGQHGGQVAAHGVGRTAHQPRLDAGQNGLGQQGAVGVAGHARADLLGRDGGAVHHGRTRGQAPDGGAPRVVRRAGRHLHDHAAGQVAALRVERFARGLPDGHLEMGLYALVINDVGGQPVGQKLHAGKRGRAVRVPVVGHGAGEPHAAGIVVGAVAVGDLILKPEALFVGARRNGMDQSGVVAGAADGRPAAALATDRGAAALTRPTLAALSSLATRASPALARAPGELATDASHPGSARPAGPGHHAAGTGRAATLPSLTRGYPA